MPCHQRLQFESDSRGKQSLPGGPGREAAVLSFGYSEGGKTENADRRYNRNVSSHRGTSHCRQNTSNGRRGMAGLHLGLL